MPRKIRQLKADLRRAGFMVTDRGKGSHEVWEHPDAPAAFVTLSGHDGDDAKPYLERDLRRAIALVARASRRATPSGEEE
jgi:predicted RNA binding protein YcfA (HicA-like mRNA interferase family)